MPASDPRTDEALRKAVREAHRRVGPSVRKVAAEVGRSPTRTYTLLKELYPDLYGPGANGKRRRGTRR